MCCVLGGNKILLYTILLQHNGMAPIKINHSADDYNTANSWNDIYVELTSDNAECLT